MHKYVDINVKRTTKLIIITIITNLITDIKSKIFKNLNSARRILIINRILNNRSFLTQCNIIIISILIRKARKLSITLKILALKFIMYF